MSELLESLSKSHDTAVGPDDIHYQFLKHLPHTALSVLLDIINDIWVSGKLPDSWKEATVIPVPKPGKDHSNPTNYRPISLTSCLCKTMERMINSRLVWFLETNNFLSKYQSGFRRGRTTTDHLIRLESLIRDAFVRGNHVVSIFFDLEKAYDTTWKYGIMKDLHEFGLRGRMPGFIKNYLSDRVFKVRLGSTLSELFEQEMGVPQGGILSVTLFIVKINKLAEIIQALLDKSLFVDDLSVSCVGKTMRAVERQLQLCLDRIEQWANENGFRFSKSKTVCVHFCQQRRLHTDPVLKLYKVIIPVVPQAKFLGVIFDKKLNFKAHIDYLRGKCQKSLNLLKVVSKLDWGADTTVLLRLYRALVRSKLDYGCVVYSSARKSYLKKLEPIQNQALRLCLGAFRTSPMQSLYIEANEPPLYLRWEKLSLQYALKLKSNMGNPTYEVAFQPQYHNFYTSKPSFIPSFGHRISDSFPQICADDTSIASFSFTKIPPWKLPKLIINTSLTKHKKDLNDPFNSLALFNELNDAYSQYKAIYTDGSKNEDKVAAAFVCSNLYQQLRLPDGASIFTAELQAIKMAFNFILNDSRGVNYVIYSDSLSSLKALDGAHFNHPYIYDIVELYIKGCWKKRKFVVLVWIPSHVGIQGNEKADKLAKEALELDIADLQVPFTDLRVNINKFIKVKWQALWDSFPNNKLHSVQPLVAARHHHVGITRREQVVLTRCRVGHSYVTHSYLLKGDPMPVCIQCNCAFTVKHILLDCVDFSVARKKYFTVPDLKTLFTGTNVSVIFQFLKEVGLFFKF